MARHTYDKGQEERTHNQAARKYAASETQTIHRDSFASQVSSVEAAEGTGGGPDMALCLLYVP